MSLESELRAALLVVAPVTNVYAPDGSDRSVWQMGFANTVTAEQRVAAQGVLDMWSQPVPPPLVSGDAILGVLSDAQAAQCKTRDLMRIAYRDDVPAANAKLVRVAKAAGFASADALRQAALQAS